MKTAILVLLIGTLGLAGCGDDNSGADCTDNDEDGYGVGSDCAGPDCDDNDNTLFEEMTLYADADGDGLGAADAIPGTFCTDGTVPAGYSAANTDCADDDPGCFTAGDPCCTVLDCTDADGDGYGTGADCTGPDCKDDDPACHTPGDLCCSPPDCIDVDGDGYGTGADCTGPDCDDNDPQAWMEVLLYTDADGDGYGNPADPGTIFCTDGIWLPMGYCDDNTDCDDDDPFAWDANNDPHSFCTLAGACIDTDGDGYGFGACSSADCDSGNNACRTPMDGCCQSGTLRCSEVINCLGVCDTSSPSYFQCVNACTDNAAADALDTFNAAQTCAAEAGCYGEEEPSGCVTAACMPQFAACNMDTP